MQGDADRRNFAAARCESDSILLPDLHVSLKCTTLEKYFLYGQYLIK
jgi:hypothetical protein